MRDAKQQAGGWVCGGRWSRCQGESRRGREGLVRRVAPRSNLFPFNGLLEIQLKAGILNMPSDGCMLCL